MIPRRTQLLAVASVVLAALSALALAVVALVPALRGSVLASQLALALTLLAAVCTTPLHAAEATRADVVFGAGLYAIFAFFRALGFAVALSRGTLDEAQLQLAFAGILHAPLLAVTARRAVAWAAVLAGIFGYALASLALRGAPMVAPGALFWFSLTLARWVQCEVFLQRALPVTDHGRLAPWRHPGPWFIAIPLGLVANSRVMQLLLEPLPVVEMRSDITEVIYVNYLVEAEKLARFVPPGLELERVGPQGRWALFTFLTYHHGHFGFSLLGPLRRLFPSPFQTNWRVHVFDPRTGMHGIRFVTNAIDYTVPAMGARMLSEGMPMHVLKSASLTRDSDGTMRLALDPGRGSAPDVQATLRPAGEGATPYRESHWDEPWRSCFADMRAFLEYCVPQDRAMDAQPWRKRVSRQEINLGIPVTSCVPLVGEVRSEAARAIVGDAKPVCFLVPGVSFRFRIEDYDALGS